MGRHRRERGATLIEASLVMPIMLLIMLGTLELGLAFKDYLTVSYGTREGSRIGALAGNDINADCDIVQGVFSTVGTGDLDDFQMLQIYKADPATGNQVSGKVNTYTLKPGGDPQVCDTLNWTVVAYGYPPADRNTAYGTSSDLDIIGVRLVYNHDWVTGFPPFRGSFTIDEETIIRMEPESFE